jgi:hypothetical protein
MGVWTAGLYRPLTLSAALSEKPSLEELRGEVSWRLRPAGTCSMIHFRRTELETIGTLPLGANPASSFVKGRQDTATITRIDQLFTS